MHVLMMFAKSLQDTYKCLLDILSSVGKVLYKT